MSRRRPNGLEIEKETTDFIVIMESTPRDPPDARRDRGRAAQVPHGAARLPVAFRGGDAVQGRDHRRRARWNRGTTSSQRSGPVSFEIIIMLKVADAVSYD